MCVYIYIYTYTMMVCMYLLHTNTYKPTNPIKKQWYMRFSITLTQVTIKPQSYEHNNNH